MLFFVIQRVDTWDIIYREECKLECVKKLFRRNLLQIVMSRRTSCRKPFLNALQDIQEESMREETRKSENSMETDSDSVDTVESMESGSAYNSFAWVYDTFMDNIPYDEWTGYLTGLLAKYDVREGLVLDLGCGTGNVTERLAERGFDMIGIDNSEEMLMEAQEKNMESGAGILYLLQDMRSFELYGTVAAVVSICDSMNYILEKEDLEQVFRLVNNYLDPEGVFIFDFNTRYKYQEVIGNQVIAENREDCSFIWENSYDEKKHINIYDLTIFIKESEDPAEENSGEEDNLFRRYQETHYQKGWRMEDMEEAATAAGMKVLAVYDAFTEKNPRKDSERLYMIVQEQGKAGPESV